MDDKAGLIIVTLIGVFVLVGLLLAGGAMAEEGAKSCAVPEEFGTIQAAVDDPGCALVKVGRGTFGENVVISRTVRIVGQGATNTIVDGGGGDAVFKIQAYYEVSEPVTMTVTLSGLKIVNGASGIINEAAVVNFDGYGEVNLDVDISLCTVVDNTGSGVVSRPFAGGRTAVQISASNITGNLGGGIDNVPVEFGAAQLTIVNSVINDNGGAGITSSGCFRPFCKASLTVTGSTISGNSGSGIDNWYTLVNVTNSTISGNTAGEGGGMRVGFYVVANVTNSTISGNTAGKGGGISSSCGTTHLNNSTVTGNSAASGGGIYIMGESTPYLDCYGSVDATHSIVANSANGGDCVLESEEYATFNDSGHNIVEDGSCIYADSSRAGDPLLGPLARNGGHTPTHALLPGSPAIDSGNKAACPQKDQRGYSRPADGDLDGTAVCDIGSFELRHFTDSFYFPTIMSDV